MLRFEHLAKKVMQIARRIGVINAEWVTKELDIVEEEATEVLEALTNRGDLRGRHHGGWYALRQHYNQQTYVKTKLKTV